MTEQAIDAGARRAQLRQMCNLYYLRQSRAEVADVFRAEDRWQAELARDYVAPGQPGPVVVASEGHRRTGLMTWGVPNTSMSDSRKPVTNVRNLESPFWRSMLDRPAHRCLVPVTEFQEWSAAPDAATGRKRAHWFSVPSRPLFAFAGIWRKVGDEARFAFLTCEPNTLVGAVHPKAMPVILEETDHEAWLTAPWQEARRLVTAYPSQLMAMT